MSVRLAEKLVWRKTEDGVVIVDPKGGNVQVLNGVGSDIWTLLSDGKSLDEIGEFVVAEYEVEKEQATTDVNAFVDDLIERGLLVAKAQTTPVAE